MLKTSKSFRAVGYMALVGGAVSIVTHSGHVSLIICTAIFMTVLAIQDGGFQDKNNGHLQTPS